MRRKMTPATNCWSLDSHGNDMDPHFCTFFSPRRKKESASEVVVRNEQRKGFLFCLYHAAEIGKKVKEVNSSVIISDFFF